MGSTSSRIAKKLSTSFKPNPTEEVRDNVEEMAIEKSGKYLVFSRRGSMYKDEDGDLAHEFYVEEPSLSQGCKPTMRRILDNLTPQGDVNYEIARLHVDFPYIIANV